MMTDRRIDWMCWLPFNYTKLELEQAQEQVRRVCGALASPDDVQVDIMPTAGGFQVWGHWSDPREVVEILPRAHAQEALSRAETALAEARAHLAEEAA